MNDNNNNSGDFIKQCLSKNNDPYEDNCEVAEVKNMYGIVKHRTIC